MMIQLYLILIWMWTSARTGAQVHAINRKTPLTQCCKDGEFYRPGLDRCLYRTDDPEPGWQDPVLYAVDENDTFLVGEDEFEISYYLPDCPKGFVPTSTNEFQVFIDGSLRVEDVIFSPGKFCINQIPSSSDPTDPEFVARFCAPDPCVGKNTKCLRKCCPQGWAIDMKTHSCQPHSSPFNVSQLARKSGGPIDIEDGESLTLLDGLGFKCHNEDIIHVDNFVISSDGMLSNSEFTYFNNEHVGQRPTDRYCIDNFVEKDNTTKLMGLKCFPTLPQFSENMIRASIVYPYLLFASALFLMATVIVYAVLPDLRNTTGISVMCFVASMAVYYMGLGVFQMVYELPKVICVSLPVLVHFACLATFCWLNILCFDYWWTLSSLKKEVLNSSFQVKSKRRLILYSLYAWGIPFIIVAVGQVLERLQLFPEHVITPNFEESQCWFLTENRPPLFAYLYGPVTIMFLVNTIFFVLIIITVCTRSVNNEESTSKRPTLSLRVILSLFLLMGALWMTESFSFIVEESPWLTLVVTDILNILSGVFIFSIFVCKKAVWQLLAKKCPCLSHHRSNVFNPRLSEKPSVSSLDTAESRFTSFNSKRFHRSTILSQLSETPQVSDTVSSSIAALDSIINERVQVELIPPPTKRWHQGA